MWGVVHHTLCTDCTNGLVIIKELNDQLSLNAH